MMDKAERARLNDEFKKRTMRYGLDAFKIFKSIQDPDVKFAYGRQLIRCASSVGANYRAACRAKSRADFINKLKIVEEEADESLYWLEFICLTGAVQESSLRPIQAEGNQILAMIVASLTTARRSVPEGSRQSSIPKS